MLCRVYHLKCFALGHKHLAPSNKCHHRKKRGFPVAVFYGGALKHVRSNFILEATRQFYVEFTFSKTCLSGA
jgi:hypothetical protein